MKRNKKIKKYISNVKSKKKKERERKKNKIINRKNIRIQRERF